MLIITASIAYDYIMDFPGLFSEHILPDQIHNLNLSFIVNNFTKRRGGAAGNISYSLGLFKTPHTLLAVAGKDFDDYKKAFEKLGIDTKHVKVYKNEYTATGIGMADKSNNQIWAFSYGASEHSHELKVKPVAKKNDLVLIGPQGAKGSMSIVKQCIELGIPYMFDPGFILTQVSHADLQLGVKHATYLIGNDYEINLIRDRIKNFDTLTKGKTIITTLAEKGVIVQTPEKKIPVKAAKPDAVVDPTGAGDAWRAGFFTGLERNFDLEMCARMGAVTASFAIEKQGGQEHIFTKKSFTKRYKDAYNDTLEL
jgi:adenosine kinase